MSFLRNIIGRKDDAGGDESLIQSQGSEPVEVSISDIRASVTVNDADETLDLAEKDTFTENSLQVLQQLKQEAKNKHTDELLNANLELQATVAFAGESAETVSSSVNTASFLFDQYLTEISRLGEATDGEKDDRVEMIEQFHAAMTEVFMKFENMTPMEEDFNSIESILAQGPEEYIRQMRQFISTDNEKDLVNVWYRDLNYIAKVSSSSNSQETILSVCFNMTLGPFANLFKTISSVFSRRDQVSSDYQALGDGRANDLAVLKDITGLVKHSRLTLVLGPPGSGKTSYLKALAGQLHRQRGVDAKVSGDVYYNQFSVDMIKNLQNWSCYVGQRDEHLPLLTVRETLQFAYACRTLPRKKSERVFEELCKRVGVEAAERMRTLMDVKVDFILAVLGLSQCAETIIGNEVLKGISGGEKRRVTLGEMLVTGAQALFLDEISTGLDSAAAYDICKYLRVTAHFMGQAIVVSLLQPPPEVVDLFDDIVLLAEGNVIYHGPRESVLEYFERLGYQRPKNKDLGDFLQELPTPTGRKYATGTLRSESTPRTPDEFGRAWKESKEGRLMADTVNSEAVSQLNKDSQEFTWEDMPLNSWYSELSLVLAWSWTYRLRKKAEIFARVFQNIFMGLIFGSLFWQIGFDEWYLKAMLFAQMPGFMQAGGIGAVPKLVEERPVFYKHTYAKFYTATSFAVCQFLVQLPFTVFDALCFGNLLYFMCGLVMDAERYAVFMILAILFGLCIGQLLRIFSYTVRSESSALVAAVLAYLLFLIFSGQVATPNVIPSYFKWFFWINPTAWVYRAMAINEFKADKYGGPGETTCTMRIPFNGETREVKVPERCGDFYLKNRQFETDEKYIGITFYILAAYTLLFLVITILSLAYVRFDREYAQDAEDDEETELDTHGQLNNNGSINSINGSNVSVPVLARCESLAVELKTLVFSDLWYSVNLGSKREENVVDLLKGVSGFATPGRMTALMGSSGAGKTTLLDVLAGRKTTGTITGHILINSHPPNPLTYKRLVGYVEQFGVHDKQSTVRESLEFSAGLRLPDHSLHRREEFVDEIMSLLELESIKDERTRSLSVEQNKRLTIAVELVSNPSVLFADEPTSGLDARAASIVMRSIQNVAKSGRTVICTIHQPSVSVFSVFDDLLLMKRGGQVVFFGELGDNCENLINYFESIPGTPKCPSNYNPATWMLEVIGAGTSRGKANATDYAAVYKTSKLCKLNEERLQYEFMAPLSADVPLQQTQYMFSPLGEDAHNYSQKSISGLATPMRRKVYNQKRQSGGHTLSSIETVYSQPFYKQIAYLLNRNLKNYWRSPEFSLSRIIVVVLVGAIITATFWQQKYRTAADTQSRIISISFMIMLTGAYNLFTIMPFQIEKRAVLFREISSGMYSSIAAVVSDGFVELPYLIVETLVGVNVVYWGIGFQQTVSAYIYYSITFFLYLYLMTSLGMFLSALLPDALSAQLSATVVIQIFQLFAGIIVPHDKLPSYYRWLYYFSAQRYSTEAIITTQFHGDHTKLCIPDGKPIETAPWIFKRFVVDKFCTSDGEFQGLGSFTGVVQTAEEFVYNSEGSFLHGYEYEHRYIDFAVLLTWCLGLRILTVITALTVDHNKR